MLAHSGTEMEGDGCDRHGPCLEACLGDGSYLLIRIRQARQDRGDQHAAAHTCLVQSRHGLEALFRRRCPWLGEPPHLAVHGSDRKGNADTRAASGLGEQREVAEHESRLRQEAERVPGFGKNAHDPLGEVVLALGFLVGIGIGPHGDVVALPSGRAQLGAHLFDRVDLHDDLVLEVHSAVKAEI